MSWHVSTRIDDRRLRDVIKGMPQVIEDAISEEMAEIEADVKLAMAEEKHGRWYGDHQASAPGESPAVDSSDLTESIKHQLLSTTEGVVGTNVEYAPALEYGTSRMAARPFFTPAAERAQKRFLERVARALGDDL